MKADDLSGVDTEFLKLFGQHFISLSCYDWVPNKRDTVERFATSGFLISVRDKWFLATAGHVIQQINDLLAATPNRSFYFGIMDNFGSDARHEEIIPFDYINAKKWATDVDTSGADFGLICIEPYYRRLIEKNNLRPFTEAQWRYTRTEPFEFHAIMGIPSETLAAGNLERKDYKMAMIPITEIEQLPPSIEPRPYPTLYAKIATTLEVQRASRA